MSRLLVMLAAISISSCASRHAILCQGYIDLMHGGPVACSDEIIGARKITTVVSEMVDGHPAASRRVVFNLGENERCAAPEPHTVLREIRKCEFSKSRDY